MAKTKAMVRLAAFPKRFGRDRKGATAVEFALIATPFFLILFAIIEVGAVLFTSTALEHASTEAVRTIRTGQVQNAGSTSNDFIATICQNMADIVPCNGHVSADVRTFADFASISSGAPLDANGNLDTGSFLFDPGNTGDIVLVRVYYVWQLQTPIISTIFANAPGNKRLIVASAAFRNEPFAPLP